MLVWRKKNAGKNLYKEEHNPKANIHDLRDFGFQVPSWLSLLSVQGRSWDFPFSSGQVLTGSNLRNILSDGLSLATIKAGSRAGLWRSMNHIGDVGTGDSLRPNIFVFAQERQPHKCEHWKAAFSVMYKKRLAGFLLQSGTKLSRWRQPSPDNGGADKPFRPKRVGGSSEDGLPWVTVQIVGILYMSVCVLLEDPPRLLPQHSLVLGEDWNVLEDEKGIKSCAQSMGGRMIPHKTK